MTYLIVLKMNDGTWTFSKEAIDIGEALKIACETGERLINSKDSGEHTYEVIKIELID